MDDYHSKKRKESEKDLDKFEVKSFLKKPNENYSEVFRSFNYYCEIFKKEQPNEYQLFENAYKSFNSNSNNKSESEKKSDRSKFFYSVEIDKDAYFDDEYKNYFISNKGIKEFSYKENDIDNVNVNDAQINEFSETEKDSQLQSQSKKINKKKNKKIFITSKNSESKSQLDEVDPLRKNSKKTEEENLFYSPKKQIHKSTINTRRSNSLRKLDNNINDLSLREFSDTKNQNQKLEKSCNSFYSIEPDCKKQKQDEIKKPSIFTNNISNFSETFNEKNFLYELSKISDINNINPEDIFKLSSSILKRKLCTEDLKKLKTSRSIKESNTNNNNDFIAEKNISNFDLQNLQNSQNLNAENEEKTFVPKLNKYLFSMVNNKNSGEIKSKFVLKQNQNKNGFEQNNLKNCRVRYRMISSKEKKFCIYLLNYFDINSVSKMCNVPLKSLKRWTIVGYERKKGGGRKTKDPAMENNVIAWIRKQQNKGNYVTTKMIKNIALKFSKDKSFLASKGWLEKLKKKYDLKISKFSKCNKSDLLSSNDDDNKKMELEGNDNLDNLNIENNESSFD